MITLICHLLLFYYMTYYLSFFIISLSGDGLQIVANSENKTLSTNNTNTNTNITPERMNLMNEKKQLLIKLKAYEKEFVRNNHRPVTRVDDIAPVSAEYKRYKVSYNMYHIPCTVISSNILLFLYHIF